MVGLLELRLELRLVHILCLQVYYSTLELFELAVPVGFDEVWFQ